VNQGLGIDTNRTSFFTHIRLATTMAGPLKIAILDDYQNLSEPQFKALDSASYHVTIFRDTLLPYNHPATPQEVKDKLVKRLEPFTVICKSLYMNS
jgi:hypothetical protein